MNRLLSTIVMLVLLVLTIYVLPVYIAVFIMSFITFMATYEFLNAFKDDFSLEKRYFYSILAGIMPFVIFYNSSYANFLTAIYILIILIDSLIYCKAIRTQKLVLSVISVTILPHAINTLTKIFLLENGKYLILIPMITAWGSDSLAYLCGKNFGKHKLIPKVSPNKTIEGSLGGILGGILGMYIFALATRNIITISTFSVVIIGALGSILGQIGDLTFSKIKRIVGIKDYGNLIPGHGGILDRFDSIIFTAPITYIILRMI